jgi:hypothetical protein
MEEDAAPPALAPGRARADSLAVLLGQALRAGDQALLEKCAARLQSIGCRAGPTARPRTAPHQPCSKPSRRCCVRCQAGHKAGA